MSQLIAIVMAAGQGTRMKSAVPKVIHPACGRPLLYYPVKAALDVQAVQVVVVVNPSTREAIQESLNQHVATELWSLALQAVPQGTGDAARTGLTALETADDDRILILSGDTPLLTGADLKPLVSSLEPDIDLSFMLFRPANPEGYGRVVRDNTGRVTAIVEQRDLRGPSQHALSEVNAGVYLARAGALRRALARLQKINAQGEFYLTDIIALMAEESQVRTVEASAEAMSGVNDRAQLHEVEQVLFRRIRTKHARAGVSLVGEPFIDDTVEIEADARIETGVRLRGSTVIGTKSVVDVGSVLENAVIAANVHVKPYSVVLDSSVGERSQVGPFAHLRPGSQLDQDVHIGNFVETKNTTVKRGAKANHLSYLGDAEVGERSNLGAGTIICNYDGFQKRRTIIGADVFVGSDAQIIAPARIGARAYIATGTTVTQDVPEGALAIGRVRQTNKEGYADPLRDRLREQARSKDKK